MQPRPPAARTTSILASRSAPIAERRAPVMNDAWGESSRLAFDELCRRFS